MTKSGRQLVLTVVPRAPVGPEEEQKQGKLPCMLLPWPQDGLERDPALHHRCWVDPHPCFPLLGYPSLHFLRSVHQFRPPPQLMGDFPYTILSIPPLYHMAKRGSPSRNCDTFTLMLLPKHCNGANDSHWRRYSSYSSKTENTFSHWTTCTSDTHRLFCDNNRWSDRFILKKTVPVIFWSQNIYDFNI